MRELNICLAIILIIVSCTPENSSSNSSFELRCENVLNLPEIFANIQVDSELVIIPYQNGNGQLYNNQLISSTGVTGLTATISSGVLANGSGSVDLLLNGVPNNQGVASFEITIDNQTCTLDILINESLSIGDNFRGGIIFYLDGSGKGLIASDSDSSVALWGCYGANLNGSNNSIPPELEGVFLGNQNTEYIVNNCTFDNRFAAKECFDFVQNGYDDWYLPSKSELNLMYQNIYGQGQANVGNFSDSFYWSSTEHDADGAWSQFFFTGGQSVSSKSQSYRVRPIRSF